VAKELHKPWCDPRECTAGFTDFHPDSSPPAHASRWFTCNPPGERQAVEVEMQLVEYVDDPKPRTFIRIARSDFEDRQVFHLTVDQGRAVNQTLSEILGRTTTKRR